MSREHSANNFMDQTTQQPPADQGAAVLVGSGDLFGSSYVAENLRSWAEDFRAQQHPVTLTLFRAAQVLEKIDATLTALRKGITEAETAATAEYNRRSEAAVVAINDSRSSDANWEEQHATYAKGKRDALRAILPLPNEKLTQDARP